MIIQALSLHHLFAYYGDHTILFPKSKQPALTIIVGPNNSGKTSIIRALKFCFYGESGLPPGTKILQLLNNKAKEEIPVGKELVGWVQVNFEYSTAEGNKAVTLRRRLSAKRVGESKWQFTSCHLCELRHGHKDEWYIDTNDRWQRVISTAVPQALFDAFFFKGEPLDGNVLGDISRIREALGQFLHEDQWKEAEQAVARIREGYAKRIRELSAASMELTEKIRAEEKTLENVAAQRTALQEREEGLAQLAAEHAAETQNLAKLGDVKAAEGARQKLRDATAAEEKAKSRIVAIESGIARELGSSLGIPFLLSAVEPVREILEELERDNILPADVSEGFVDRVLARKTCICGHRHNDTTRAAWEEYRKKTLQAGVNEGLGKLLNWVKEDGHLSITARAKRTSAVLGGLIQDRKEAVRENHEAVKGREDAHKMLEVVPHDEIRRIAKRLKEIDEQCKLLRKQMGTIETSLRQVEATYKRIKSEIKEISQKSGVDQNAFKSLQEKMDRATSLHNALQQCRNRLGSYFHVVLQNAITKSYDSKAYDGSKAIIDRFTLLPSVQVAGSTMRALGGGQSQLLALSYVVALARLRQQMHEQMEKLRVHLGRIDDLSFFMDSPLSNMETHYKQAALDLIPGCARQVVLLLWKEDWNFAKPTVETKADAILAIEVSTTQEDVAKLDEQAPHYVIRGKKHQLIKPLSIGDSHPRSRIINIP